MTKTTFTATLPNGEIRTRKTERTYTHVVVVESHYADGRVSFTKGEWAGRLDLAQKNAAKLEQAKARYMASTSLPAGWTRLNFYAVHIIPVSA